MSISASDEVISGCALKMDKILGVNVSNSLFCSDNLEIPNWLCSLLTRMFVFREDGEFYLDLILTDPLSMDFVGSI